MSKRRVLLHHSAARRPVPASIAAFAERERYPIVDLMRAEDVLLQVSRSYPTAVILDGSDLSDEMLRLCGALKTDGFTAVVPLIVYLEGGDADSAAAVLEAGADEVLNPFFSSRESDLRLDLALRRAERDVSVHPTTLLPGTVQIERDFAERIRGGRQFAVCYADLDHFKEFNDRYGYNHGDRVILLVSRILRDVVRARAPGGFVGHIGGDDFIFSVPLEAMDLCCSEVLEVFGELIPLQYTAEDRERGSYRARDRRGNVYDVPLMTLSIGVVTNQRRELTHTGQISELATEMKTHAKSVAGSVYLVDRRRGVDAGNSALRSGLALAADRLLPSSQATFAAQLCSSTE